MKQMPSGDLCYSGVKCRSDQFT